MPALLYNSGALRVTIQYSWRKHPNSPYNYRRRYPKEVRAYFENIGQPVGEYHIVALRTHDPQLAARQIIRLARQDDAEWMRIRQGLAPRNSRTAAETLLLEFGIDIRNLEAYRHGHVETQAEAEGIEPAAGFVDEREVAVDAFIDHLRKKVPNDDSPDSHLKEHELTALHLLNGTYEYRLSDARHYYLEKRGALENKKKVNDTNRAFALVLDTLGDRPLGQYRRRDVQHVIQQGLAKQLKTASIRKRLGTVRAAVNTFIEDYELHNTRNPFTKFDIPNLGEDSEERESLTPEQLSRLREYICTTPGTTSNIIGLLTDTGARPSEIVGLWTEDIRLDAPVPHVIIHVNPMRRLKTKASKRKIPLVGDALLAAERALKEAGDSRYLFPRYMTDEGAKNNNALAAVRKVMVARDCGTAYCLRHTMRTRLRNADVPEPRAKEIQGWARESIADHYGDQTALENLQADLLKTL